MYNLYNSLLQIKSVPPQHHLVREMPVVFVQSSPVLMDPVCPSTRYRRVFICVYTSKILPCFFWTFTLEYHVKKYGI